MGGGGGGFVSSPSQGAGGQGANRVRKIISFALYCAHNGDIYFRCNFVMVSSSPNALKT